MTGYNPFSLEGKTILITGGSSGIGKATAIECSKMGAKVIIVARNEEKLKATLSMLEGNGHQYFICDLNDVGAVEKMVVELPQVDGVVNNAGFTRLAPIPFVQDDLLKDILQTNTVAPIMITKLMLKKKKVTKGASFVFTNSVAGLGKVTLGNTMYASSKGALTAFVQGAAKELAPKGVRLNAVCPGMVETEIMQFGTVSEEQLEKDRLTYPLKRYGKPEEIAWAIIYLLSDASSWVTGTNLIIDGGFCVA